MLHLLEIYYPAQTVTLAIAIDHEYTLLEKDIAFAKRSKHPMDRRMPIAAYLLAVIKVLDQYEFEYESTRKLILELATLQTKPKNKIQQYLKKAVPKLLTSTLGRYLLERTNKRLQKAPSQDGFAINIITAKEKTLGFGYGVDILGCGVCKLFAKHHYQAYAPLLCEVDYITASLAGLELVRNGTIANGAAVCDFRYKTIK